MEAPRRKTVETTKDGIMNSAESMTYLGVELPKAEVRGTFTPGVQHIERYINDPYIAQPMQRDIAAAWKLGQPIMLEGGTSLGKSSTVRKMCAELGYELLYINLNGGSDPENLMGRYVPNAERKGSDDPEYAFADGPVTAGLRQEEGKTRVILIDEMNSATPETLIRLHEVLDALEVGGNVVLTEDAAEAITTSKEKTKMVALTNPAGKGYLGRNVLDPAQLRRWVVKKYPNELPRDAFAHITENIFLGPKERGRTVEPAYYTSREKELSLAELRESPQFEPLVKGYMEFHESAKDMLSRRSIAADQPQPFSFDDRMEPRRVLEFVRTFARDTYGRDLIDTFKAACEYYYVGKIEKDSEKARLRDVMVTALNVPVHEDPRRRTPETKREGEIYIQIGTLELMLAQHGITQNDMRGTFREYQGDIDVIDMNIPGVLYDQVKRSVKAEIGILPPDTDLKGPERIVRNKNNIFAEIKARGWGERSISWNVDPHSRRIYITLYD